MTKNEARKMALSLRKENDVLTASSTVLDAVLLSKVLEPFSKIGIYYPIGREINVIPLTQVYKDKCFYLPITREDIDFVKYDREKKLVSGPFHTMEPEGNIISKDELECIIIPCVAISLSKQRIGYGKGYYDRYLENYHGLKIGICYKNAVIDCVMDSFDVVLDEIFLG